MDRKVQVPTILLVVLLSAMFVVLPWASDADEPEGSDADPDAADPGETGDGDSSGDSSEEKDDTGEGTGTDPGGQTPGDDPPDDPPTDSVTKLHGCIYDIPALEERVVIADIYVITWISPDREYQRVLTDVNGEFTVDFNENVKYISFFKSEYTVKGWCSELKSVGENAGLFQIALRDSSQVDGVHELYDDSGFTVLVSRTNASIFGTIQTVIDGETTAVRGATVSVTDGRISLSTVTDSTGFFTLNLSSGVEYSLTVTCGGFDSYMILGLIPSEEPISINLVQKSNDFFLGMNLPHMLTLVGIVIIVIVSLVALILVRRPTSEDGLHTVNDLQPVKKKKN
jgi:hypothetical protein